METGKLVLRTATEDDAEQIYRLRHEVYARELGQHPRNGTGRLTDAHDGTNRYLVAARGAEVLGFVSITPPWAGRFSVDKYVSRDDFAPLRDAGNLFEVRLLTVRADQRGARTGSLLMYAALRWVASRGGRGVVVIGRQEVLPLYLDAGLQPLGRTVRSGAVTFELMWGDVPALTERTVARHGPVLRELARGLDWRLDMPYLPPADGCEHGGASFTAIGTGFDDLRRRHEVVTADVLDAWFPPAPGVLAGLTEDPGWLARTSPPSGARGLVEAVEAARGLPAGSVAVGAGSSDLVFRAFREWVSAGDRVLVLDPTYAEYAHVLERVVGCRVDRFRLRPEEGWRLDTDRLRSALATGYDLVVLVNPNNPTGRHVAPAELAAVLDTAPPTTRVWVDEAYVEYVGPGQSLERYAAASTNVVVCKSMSKVYALSGLRAAYLVGLPPVVAGLRHWTPPWPVSLPAQLAGVRALADPEYYARRWRETAELRADLGRRLTAAGAGEVTEAVGNFLLLALPAGGPVAADVVRDCRRHGVYVRDLTPVSPAFRERTIRVAVRGAAENLRVTDALTEVLAGYRPPAPRAVAAPA